MEGFAFACAWICGAAGVLCLGQILLWIVEDVFFNGKTLL